MQAVLSGTATASNPRYPLRVDPVSYCRDMVSSGPELPALVIAFAPKQQQQLLWGTAALRQALFEIPIIDEPEVATAKLTWWRDEVVRLNRGEPRHPISKAIYQCSEHWENGFSNDAIWVELQAEIDRESRTSNWTDWVDVACSTGGLFAALENQWLGLAVDEQVSHQIGGLIRGWSWVQAQIAGRLFAPASYLARHQLSRRTLADPRQANAINTLRCDLTRRLSKATTDVCDDVLAGSRDMPTSQLLALRMAQAAGARAGRLPKAVLLRLAYVGWQTARRSAKATVTAA